jgi:hypothetical protein
MPKYLFYASQERTDLIELESKTELTPEESREIAQAFFDSGLSSDDGKGIATDEFIEEYAEADAKARYTGSPDFGDSHLEFIREEK